jgi:hypothetical protein
VHGLISAVFLACIGKVYVDAARRRADSMTLIAVAALATEGVLVAANGGDCPLGPAFRELGDDKPFFELLLPAAAARRAVPVLAGVTAVGVVALGVRCRGDLMSSRGT